MPASKSEPVKIFLTGATGYIGGSVLATLLAQPAGTYEISALIRDNERAKKLEELGVKPVIGDLDTTTLLEQSAYESDVVLHTADADHLDAAKALTAGLEKRASENATFKPIYIHTSGTGVLLDNSRGMQSSPKIYRDTKLDDIHSLDPCQPHRPIDMAVMEAADRKKIDTAIICPPLIYGPGTGPFNRRSQQVPMMISASVQKEKAVYIGEGLNIWSNVHVQDLAEAYHVILTKMLSRSAPINREGYYFVENGENNFRHLAFDIAQALKKTADIGDGLPHHVDDKEVPQLFGTDFAFLVLGGNSRSRSEKARDLGWVPKHPPLSETIEDEVVGMLKEKFHNAFADKVQMSYAKK